MSPMHTHRRANQIRCRFKQAWEDNNYTTCLYIEALLFQSYLTYYPEEQRVYIRPPLANEVERHYDLQEQ